MQKNGETLVARFSVPIELANYGDLVLVRNKMLDPSRVRRLVVEGLVDSGATKLVLPEAVAKQLGLAQTDQVRVTYADGRKGLRKQVEGVHVTLQRRREVFTAVVEPKRKSALIGAFVLEALDFLIDPKKQTLYPRDPDFVVSELE